MEEIVLVDRITIKVNVDGVIKGAFQNDDKVKADDAFWNVNDTLIVDRNEEIIEYYHNIFAGNQIYVKYHLEEYIQMLLEDLDARGLFIEKGDAPEDALFEDGVTAAYEIIVEAKGLETRIIKGRYCMEELPKDYAKFIHLIGKAFSQFETWGDIFNPSLYAKPLRREDDIIYCAVEFGEYSKEYHYITDDDTIQEGDTVIVPVGVQNREMEATVFEKIYCKKSEVPYPLSKVKKIIKKVDSINNITPNLMESLVGKRIKVICEDFLSYIGIVNNFEYNEEDDEFEFYLQTDEENIHVNDYEIWKIEIKEG